MLLPVNLGAEAVVGAYCLARRCLHSAADQVIVSVGSPSNLRPKWKGKDNGRATTGPIVKTGFHRNKSRVSNSGKLELT